MRFKLTALSSITMILFVFLFVSAPLQAQSLIEEKLDIRGAILKTRTKSFENFEIRNSINKSRTKMRNKVVVLSMPDSNQTYYALHLSSTTLSGIQYIDAVELPNVIHFLKVVEREYPGTSQPDSNTDIKYVTQGGMEMRFRYKLKTDKWGLYLRLDDELDYFNISIDKDKIPLFINRLEQAIDYIDKQR